MWVGARVRRLGERVSSECVRRTECTQNRQRAAHKNSKRTSASAANFLSDSTSMFFLSISSCSSLSFSASCCICSIARCAAASASGPLARIFSMSASPSLAFSIVTREQSSSVDSQAFCSDSESALSTSMRPAQARARMHVVCVKYMTGGGGGAPITMIMT